MSKFSGKYDFADFVESVGSDAAIDKYKIYIGWNVIPLKFETAADLIPYYPHLIIFEAHNESGCGVVRLTEYSYVDEQENDMLKYDLEDLLRYWRRCKRMNKEFHVDDAYEAMVWYINDAPPQHIIELTNRVKENGDKATIDGVHIKHYDNYRRYLFDEMTAHGWDRQTAAGWCFGLRRAAIILNEININT